MKRYRCDIENYYYTTIDKTKIYYDIINNRVKILNNSNISIQSLNEIISFASSHNVGKIICNSDIENVKSFSEQGFCIEGKIDGFYKGKDAICMSYFIDSSRKNSTDTVEKNWIIKQCLKKKNTYNFSDTIKYSIRTATPDDVGEIVDLFSTVFLSYPTPVYDQDYLRQTMNGKILYKVAVFEGKIVGIASADMDSVNLNAEMTDCATYPEHRGKGILSNIIYQLEVELKNMNFITLYSLSRAINPGINMVLSKHNYNYAGRLIKNCNICNAFEDMNIWAKKL
jgi:putative beta-lysine N-acetyltransferase